MFKVKPPLNLQGEVGLLVLSPLKWVFWSIWNFIVQFKSAILQTNFSSSSLGLLHSYQDKCFSSVRIATCATERAT